MSSLETKVMAGDLGEGAGPQDGPQSVDGGLCGQRPNGSDHGVDGVSKSTSSLGRESEAQPGGQGEAARGSLPGVDQLVLGQL